jgi:hypothetical protein
MVVVIKMLHDFLIDTASPALPSDSTHPVANRVALQPSDVFPILCFRHSGFCHALCCHTAGLRAL